MGTLIFLGFIALVFVTPLLGAVGGAFAGWMVSLFFDETIRTVLTHFGLNMEGIAIWQLGATLGFIGGFFRSHQTNNNG
ncbi:MAG TPA: hypothetical protein VFO41_04120 [Alphaproteobacteria bacterium]|nr:hypothetical protein [Alphaproteobacteria bacterium]